MNPVLVRRQGALGRLTLNRPEALNALNLPMIRILAAALDAWEHDDAVSAVLLDGAGERGLCAGGDVRFLADDAAAGGDQAAVLLSQEYRLDARIARYPKPYVALMDGVVMGGGVGVSAHGSLRVVTPRTVLAMPEVSIGYVPDVGGSWLLGHAPGELGLHLALSATRLGAADAIGCGLADVAVASERLGELVAALVDGAEPAAAVAGLAVDPGVASLAAHREWIDRCYTAPGLPGILDALRDAGEPDAAQAAEAIGRAAPLAATMALRALRAARELPSLERALEAEYGLTRCCVRWPDFAEGVRALLVERDGSPRWDPPCPEDVTDEVVARFLRGVRPTDPPLGLLPG
ncbi:enoyl-CoA hydratase/isomerase family protein [Pseudonocardia asaccharolytica]|uniref:3-hydroxyisobutyryl-CoA hydrolase n=1 Tax=Pseudonocardia asaccharolytica DSM 44247 = NBRC 16224 TaxID=1123024 RepID=A0A511CZ33_9PSEU|nr:enoyl-CoA hydratase/isomerase family protein [Pseudonocardia asaccharolytica]GEL17737.1 3-hydroxyisobutyryl-CoA hydrolase [Pseudonocardia asaccharolytica DSM 44247 = NBRC 16224]